MWAMKPRIGKPLPVGNEGSGIEKQMLAKMQNILSVKLYLQLGVYK